MRVRAKDLQPALVFEETTQAGQAWPKVVADPSIWTDRMLAALVTGVKGSKWYSLGDKAFSEKALNAAFERVKANKGAPGTDGWTVRRFESEKEQAIPRLSSALLAGTYRPSPVRRVYIPKPGTNEKRPLGIPTVRDRVIQSALKAALEPIFERKFREGSFGFRPGRSCRQALQKVWTGLKEGYGFVVDADFRKFFDTIPHEVIVRGVETEVSDGKILELIRAYLAQGVMEGGVLSPAEDGEEGVPQGSPLSPLLANIALHDLDVLAEDAGWRIVRYADDFVILCRTREEAENALERVQEWTAKTGLSLHPEKTRIVDCEAGQGFEFLGHVFTKGRVHPRKKSIQNLRDKVREQTPRNSGRSLQAMIQSLNPILRGWAGYFRTHSTEEDEFKKGDQFVRKRLRAVLDKRQGRRTSFNGLANKRWKNAFFTDQGLYSMKAAWEKRPTLS